MGNFTTSMKYVTSSMRFVASSMWDVVSYMSDFIDYVCDVHALCRISTTVFGLSHHLFGLL